MVPPLGPPARSGSLCSASKGTCGGRAGGQRPISPAEQEERVQVVPRVFLFASDVWEGNLAKGPQSGSLTPTSSIQALERFLCS